VLDWIITDKLYHAPGKNYSPGHMHLRKSAVVNTHFLGYISLRSFVTEEGSLPSLDVNGAPVLRTQKKNIHLFQCMLHSSTRILADQENSFARYIKLANEIETALTSGNLFPWALLTRLQAPKFLGDIVEALLGAIWLDSKGDFDVIRGVLMKLGILPILDRIIAENVDVQHPVSRLGLWASRNHKKVEYQYEKSEGNVTCVVILHHFTDKTMKEAEGEPSIILRVKTPDKGLRAEAEARFHAANEAVLKLEVQTIEQMMEEDLLLELDMDEDVPEEDE
jgi:endoribonuclease Dicer